MTITEVVLSLLPLLLVLVAGLLLVQKSGLLQQRAHRQRVEDLLERIASAVEGKDKT